MAAYTPQSSRLALRINVGTDKVVLRSLSWSNIDPAATADNVNTVAQALGTLLAYPIMEIQKADTDLVA